MQKLYVRLAYVSFENAFALTPYFLLQLACVQKVPPPSEKNREKRRRLFSRFSLREGRRLYTG